MENLNDFWRGDYMPHGHCYLWHPGILWTNVISDLLIAAAYASIPLALVIFARKRKDIDFTGILLLFACFILFCGITHLFSIYTIWHGAYGTHGVLKAMTAFVSVLTAIVLYKNLNNILAIPTVTQLESALDESNQQKLRNAELEIKRKADAIFQFTTELMPTGLLVIDSEKKIRLVNQELANIFEYDVAELKDKPLDILIPSEVATHHGQLVENYMQQNGNSRKMVAGRIVRGKTKFGGIKEVSITLTVHKFEGETHTFASVADVGKVFGEQANEFEWGSRIRRAVEAAKIGIWEWNVRTDKVWYSDKTLEYVNKPGASEAKLDYWREHIHPNYVEHLESKLQEHFKTQQHFSAEYLGKGPNNRYEWYRTTGDTVFDTEGTPLLMSGTLINIDEQKRIAEKLSQKTEFLNQVLEKSLTGLFIYHMETQKCRFINPEFTQISGYTQADLDSLHNQDLVVSLIHENDSEKVKQYLKSTVLGESHENLGIQFRLKHRSGNWLWCYSKFSVYARDKKQRVTEILGAFFDISELKQREEEIKRLALDFYTTFEQAAVGISHNSKDGHFIKVNQKTSEIFGFSTHVLLKKSIYDLVDKTDVEKFRKEFNSLYDGESDQLVCELRCNTSEGRLIWVNLTVALVKESVDNARHVISVFEDITQKKLIELDLEESNASLERFAYSASHDLQEPLRKISTFGGLLKAHIESKVDDPDAIFQLEKITDASNRMSNMIDQLLQLSRYSRKKISKSNLKLSDIVNQAIDDLSQLIADKKGTVHLEADCEVWGESNSLQQVFRNLITNSLIYAKDDISPKITVSSQVATNFVMIQLKDNGTGFPDEHANRVFEPFRRLVGRDKPGTGMGLAICKQIITAHGGTILAQSNEGEGAIFTIQMPTQASDSHQDYREKDAYV